MGTIIDNKINIRLCAPCLVLLRELLSHPHHLVVRKVLVRLEEEVALHVELLAERGEPSDGVVGSQVTLASILHRETQSITEDTIYTQQSKSPIACRGVD